MILPENRYKFSSYGRKKFNIKLIIIPAVIICCTIGVVFVFLKGDILNRFDASTNGKDALYELWETRQYNAVINRCTQTLLENPMDAEALVFCGFSYFYVGVSKYSLEDKIDYFDRAVITLRKAELVEDRPFPGGIKYILGKSYYHKGKFYMDQAVRYLEDSIEYGYIGDDTFEYLGLAYCELERYQQGIEYFLRAIDKNPTDILLLTIAQTYYKMHDMGAAKEFLIRTINKTDDITIEEKSRFLLGQIFIDDGALLQAEEQFKEVLKKNPKSADAHFILGNIYEKMNETIKARAQWRKALQIDSSHYGARLKYYD